MTSFEGPDLHFHTKKLCLTRQLFIFKARCTVTATSVEVVPEVQSKTSRVMPATHSYARAITKLVHFILVGADPSFAVIALFKSKNKTLAGAVKLFTNLPCFEAKTPKLPAILVFDYYQSGVFPFGFVKKCVHGNSMVRNSVD